MPLTKEVSEKWANALVSTSYGQHRGAISGWQHKSFCCVGIAAIEVLGMNPEAIGVSAKGSTECAEELGLTPSESHLFFDMNDGGRLSFVEIAQKLRDGSWKDWKIVG